MTIFTCSSEHQKFSVRIMKWQSYVLIKNESPQNILFYKPLTKNLGSRRFRIWPNKLVLDQWSFTLWLTENDGLNALDTLEMLETLSVIYFTNSKWSNSHAFPIHQANFILCMLSMLLIIIFLTCLKNCFHRY